MRIIYTCPKCGADLDEVVLTTYPPKYLKVCRNLSCGWSHVEEPEEDAVVRVPYDPHGERRQWPEPVDLLKYGIWSDADYYIPDCCRNCSNHPSNGGSGICCCSLPDMTKSITAPKGKTWTVTTHNNGTYYVPWAGDADGNA